MRRFTDNDGRPCRVSDDSLLAAMHQLMPQSLEESLMLRQDEFTTYEELLTGCPALHLRSTACTSPDESLGLAVEVERRRMTTLWTLGR